MAETPEGSKVGPYRLLTQLGSGAMGRVFLATDPTGRQAAVKLVRSDLAEIAAFRKRFSRELDVAQRVHGPHIAEIYDAQPDGSQPWLATEYVPGPTLQEAIEQGGCFDSARLRAFASAVAEALQAIHAADVVHRDLKPSNILLGPDGPKVIDFGVARAIDASLLTNTGQTLGTPAYMSPEQADGRSVQSASDVFALGALLVFASTGRLAFGDGPALAILHRVVNNEPELDGVAADDAELLGIIRQCLAKDPDDRPSPRQLIETLGDAPWEPLTSVAWQPPQLGVGLPLTVNDAAGAPTVALQPKRNRGKRIALISAATLAVLIVAAVAIVEGGSDSGHDTATGKVGEPLTGASSGGSFPAGGDSSNSSSSGGSASTGADTGSSPSPPGSPAVAVNPGNPPAPTSGSSTSIAVGQNPGGGSSTAAASHSSTAPGDVTKPSTPASKTTSKPAPPPSTTAPPPPAHNPPAAFVHPEVSVSIPGWVGMATVQVSWATRADATGYELHYTIDNSTDQTVSVNGTSYSYQIPAGSTSCIQARPVNQYGKPAWYPAPIFCFNSFGQVVSGSI
ncbi:serine/threonine-protein kinase [Catenulispora subtropica]|uniref:serine/threonine protein kinase n=1 Tax=Catenulispora subtropica TaxID=450798 RepID=UPI0031CF8BB4